MNMNQDSGGISEFIDVEIPEEPEREEFSDNNLPLIYLNEFKRTQNVVKLIRNIHKGKKLFGGGVSPDFHRLPTGSKLKSKLAKTL